MNMIPCNCEKPETEDSRVRLTGVCFNCGHKIIRNKGKWLHMGYGKITKKCYHKKKDKMNKTIMIIGLFFILITLVGCNVSYTCYVSNNPNKTIEVSTTNMIGAEDYILGECRKKLCDIVIIKNE